MSQTAPARRIAVIDIGKTNAKVALHDLVTGADTGVRTVPNRVRTDGPYPHFDTDALFAFILDSLAALVAEGGFDAISVTTHGASCAVVGEDDLVLPMLDYEYDGPETLRPAYEHLRPPFAETASAAMPNGLNVGAQLFWLQETFPADFAKARHILFVPQYWAWRLTGVAANEITSIGCHTDLWMPMAGRFSALVEACGWTPLFPPMRSAFDCLGPLKPDLARRIGLGTQAMPVHCGIHDSNASLLPHLMRHAPPFTVLSTGTWVVSFAVGGRNLPIDPAHGVIVNADAFGRTELCGRFMGGREFDILTDHAAAEPSEAEIAEVLESRVMALPSFVPGTGPFPKGKGRWTSEPSSLSPGLRTAAASLYCALVAAELLRLTGTEGPTIVEGPFARNRLFLDALEAVTGRLVERSTGATGTTAGAALLAGPAGAAGLDATNGAAPARQRSVDHRFSAYAAEWRERAGR